MSSYNRILSIDPGASGGAALFDKDTGPIGIQKFSGDLFVRGALIWAEGAGQVSGLAAVIEEVHASPIMSPSSAFAFGENFGLWRGALVARGIPVFLVTPQRWQKDLRLPKSGGVERKRLLKERALKVFPGQPVTLATADALLLGDWAVREINAGREPGIRL